MPFPCWNSLEIFLNDLFNETGYFCLLYGCCLYRTSLRSNSFQFSHWYFIRFEIDYFDSCQTIKFRSLKYGTGKLRSNQNWICESFSISTLFYNESICIAIHKKLCFIYALKGKVWLNWPQFWYLQLSMFDIPVEVSQCSNKHSFIFSF